MCRWVAYAGPEIYLEDTAANSSNGHDPAHSR